VVPDCGVKLPGRAEALVQPEIVVVGDRELVTNEKVSRPDASCAFAADTRIGRHTTNNCSGPTARDRED